MNDKVYANYLMHGRTKGSRNGISTTKGYTAVGQKAKGKLVNGKYVYDTPVAYGGNTEMMAKRKKGLAEKAKAQGASNDWQQQANTQRAMKEYMTKASNDRKAKVQAAKTPTNIGASQAGDFERWKQQNRNNIAAKKEAALKEAAVKGSQNDWQQQAALEQWKKQNQNAIAAKKKKAEAYNKASDAYRLGLSYPVDQMANRTRTQNEHYNKNWKNNTTINYDSPGTELDSKKAKIAAYDKGRTAVNKAQMNGTNTNASQSADLARWAQQNRNNIAASKKATAKQKLIKKADASYDAYQKSVTGSKNNWQQQANAYRSVDESYNKVLSGKSKDAAIGKSNAELNAKNKYSEQIRSKIASNNLDALRNRVYEDQNKRADAARQQASYNKMSSTQKNAMQNDPRYSTGLGPNGVAMLYSGPRGKNDYSGKNDSRAPTLITLNGSEKMYRDPYFETWSKSTNKQEVAAAQAKNKEFMNDFRKSKERNSRSDLGNAVADAKEDAKQAWKNLKKKFKKKK